MISENRAGRKEAGWLACSCRLALCLALSLLSGCAALRSQHRASDPPPPLLNLSEMVAYPDEVLRPSDAGTGLQKKVRSLVIHESDIREVLKLLFHESDLNLILEPEVKGMISLRYRDMTVEEIMEAILDAKGYLYTLSKHSLRIGKRGMRVFTLNLAGGGKSSAWKALELELKMLMSKTGQMLLNANAGTIMVTDQAENLDRIEVYIDMIEEAMSRQVLIETKIIEVILSDTFQFGIDYSLFSDMIGLSAARGALEGGAALSQSLSPKGGAIKFGVAKANKFSVLLDILQTQGQVNVLSSPRIVTLNNMKATINIAEQIPVIERIIVDSTAGTRTEFDISFQDAGINLEVTPKIGPSGEMIVNVKPKVTEQTGTVTTPDGLQTQPILNVRESSNSIKVRDGESIVIGGFIQNRKTEAVSKVPFLGDLPVISPLFRSNTQKMEKVELIIILSPRILSGETNQALLAESLGRIRRMTRPFSDGILKGDQSDFTKGFLDQMDRKRPIETVRIEASRLTRNFGGKKVQVSRKGMARHYLKKGHRALAQGLYDKAISSYETALFFDPLDGSAYFRLALIYEAIGNKGKSRQMTERYLLGGHSNFRDLNRLAMRYSSGGDQELAAQLLETALMRDSRNPLLHNNLGLVYKRMGKPEIAQRSFEASLSTEPEYPEALYNLALVLEEQHFYLAAISYYKRFLARATAGPNRRFSPVAAHLENLRLYLEESAQVTESDEKEDAVFELATNGSHEPSGH